MIGAMVPQLRFPEFVDEWDEIAFDEALVSLPTRKHQVFTTEFQKAGTFPVIDQGADFIAGYSDDASKFYSDVPIIAFGDHTTILKYVDFPFVVGADGVKLIKPKAWNAQFAYYALSAYPVEQEG
jgi:type I restriction enzyme S subunit